MEGIDNATTYDNAVLDANTTVEAKYEPELLGGVVTLTATTPNGVLTFVPYYSWDNREAGHMRVWVDYNE